MLLTLTTTHDPATDLGYLLHKNPAKLDSFELSLWKAHVFYPEATAEGCCTTVSESFSTACSRVWGCKAGWLLYCWRIDVERIIDEIQQLEEIFEAPDIRPLTPSDISAANRRHDEALANSPWFLLWQHGGVCCRPEAPVLQLPESRS